MGISAFETCLLLWEQTESALSRQIGGFPAISGNRWRTCLVLAVAYRMLRLQMDFLETKSPGAVDQASNLISTSTLCPLTHFVPLDHLLFAGLLRLGKLANKEASGCFRFGLVRIQSPHGQCSRACQNCMQPIALPRLVLSICFSTWASLKQ